MIVSRPRASEGRKYPLVVFDFDGTLIDSERCITISLERALAGCGCACDVAGVRDRIGLPLQTIIRETSPGIDEALIEAVITAYRQHYAEIETELIELFPGARETLEALHRDGVQLAIATNKYTERAALSAARLGIGPLFDAVVGADQVERAKPHPDILQRVMALTARGPEETLMVGDTIWDLEMAARAGVASCAVTWGNQGTERLRAAGPAHLIDAFPALLDVVQSVAP